MKPCKDMSGQKHGYLTVIKRGENRGKTPRWVCLCDCGNETIVDGSKIRSGHTKSCGCYVSLFAKTHGAASADRAKEYSVWAAMIKRCNNKTDPQYPDYGGRGINVCERWLSYKNFIADVGKRPSDKHSLDRWPNNDGNYEPGNFRWATMAEQNRNHRRNVYLEACGKRMVITDWCKELGVGNDTIHRHLKMGKSFEDICEYFKTDLFKRIQSRSRANGKK